MLPVKKTVIIGRSGLPGYLLRSPIALHFQVMHLLQNDVSRFPHRQNLLWLFDIGDCKCEVLLEYVTFWHSELKKKQVATKKPTRNDGTVANGRSNFRRVFFEFALSAENG